MAKNILFGITGGIAVYKVLDIISFFRKKNYNTQVIMTENATKFVSPVTFAAISGNPVYVDEFDNRRNIPHIELADNADIFLIAPATFNIIGKISHGLADDLLTSVSAAIKCRKIIAPAMNVNMYENSILQRNLFDLQAHGWEIIEPDAGSLACGYEGKGRLANTQKIIEFIEARVPKEESSFLFGYKLLVTAGASQEDIDPVRYITNRSSGKMGLAMCNAAMEAGATVKLIHGRMSVSIPPDIPAIYARSAREMETAVKDYLTEYDALIMAAAVADFRPKVLSTDKIKKKNSPLNLELIRNPDILKNICNKFPEKIIIGFAAESRDLLENAHTKLMEKNMDMIVANDISDIDAGFASDNNRVVLLFRDGMKKHLPLLPKTEVAKMVLKHLHLLLKKEDMNVIDNL
jgi:phosphopantothenoylcysteine decarboxylase / phosphopantothenate---cysteine ligase